jgi:hypothetical protein
MFLDKIALPDLSTIACYNGIVMSEWILKGWNYTAINCFPHYAPLAEEGGAIGGGMSVHAQYRAV